MNKKSVSKITESPKLDIRSFYKNLSQNPSLARNGNFINSERLKVSLPQIETSISPRDYNFLPKNNGVNKSYDKIEINMNETINK